jgi:peptidoglycan/LPS O-acetylase OafA/YrhL
MKPLPNAQIPALTGLRFFAALIVVAHHFAKPDSGLLANFTQHSFIGVTLFFVLSGFILSYTYVEQPGEMKGSKRAFWAARFARIYPAYLLGLILIAPFILLWGHESKSLQLGVGASAVLLLQSWFHPIGPWYVWNMWNPPGWSLSAEAFFYLLFPIFCVPISNLRTRSLLAIMALCWGASILATLVYLSTGTADRNLWMFDPLLRLPEFVLGMVAGIAWKRRATMVPQGISAYVAPAAIVILVAAMCAPVSDEYFYNGMTAPIMVLIVCSLAYNRGALAAFLSWRPIVVLGGASYSLYILHWPLWRIWQYLIDKFHLKFSFPEAIFASYLLFAVIASYVCFRWLEEPANKLLRKVLTRTGGQPSRDGGRHESTHGPVTEQAAKSASL